MTDGQDDEINNVVELYKLRICAALDEMPIDQVRALVAEIEARLADEKCTYVRANAALPPGPAAKQ